MDNKTSADEILLDFPLTLPTGETVTRLVMRRAKVRDMKTAQRRATGKDEQEIVLFSLVCDPPLTPEDLEDMDLADYGKLQRTFQGMVGGA